MRFSHNDGNIICIFPTTNFQIPTEDWKQNWWYRRALWKEKIIYFIRCASKRTLRLHRSQQVQQREYQKVCKLILFHNNKQKSLGYFSQLKMLQNDLEAKATANQKSSMSYLFNGFTKMYTKRQNKWRKKGLEPFSNLLYTVWNEQTESIVLEMRETDDWMYECKYHKQSKLMTTASTTITWTLSDEWLLHVCVRVTIECVKLGLISDCYVKLVFDIIEFLSIFIEFPKQYFLRYCLGNFLNYFKA